MDSNVTKYEVMISDASRAERDVARKEKALEKSRKTLEKRMLALTKDCVRCFDKAVVQFNKSPRSHYQIFDANITCIVLEKVAVCAELRLKFHSGGREPRESFDRREQTEILSIFKLLVDEELKKQGIPLTFHSFSVPIGYYPK